jgi:arsenite methyltransferase
MSTERQHIDAVKGLFDEWAVNGRAEGMETGHTPMARPAFERLNLQPGQRYLDIGCGNGYTVRWASETAQDVHAIGIDVSDEMVSHARALSESFSNCRFISAPFPLPILKAQAFDAIFSMEVFYYLPNLPWALMSTLRLLKPGGLFACVVDFYEENSASHGWAEDIGIELNLLSTQGWQDAMTEVGFEIVEQTRLLAPAVPGETPNWRQTEGSLLTLVQRPQS